MSESNINARTSPLFTCRESKEAQTQLDNLANSHSQFPALWQGVVWLLMRNPYKAGNLMPGWTDIFVLKTYDFLAIGLPVLFVYYKIIDVGRSIMEIVRVNAGAP
jgi:hypothetical protein